MSHINPLQDADRRASAAVRVLSPTTQAHTLLTRAVGFIATGRYNLADTSLTRAQAIIDRQEESLEEGELLPPFVSLRALTVVGMLASARLNHQLALSAHEDVAEALAELVNNDELATEDPSETSAHIQAFLKLHLTCLTEIRQYMRYNFEDDYALLEGAS